MNDETIVSDSQYDANNVKKTHKIITKRKAVVRLKIKKKKLINHFNYMDLKKIVIFAKILKRSQKGPLSIFWYFSVLSTNQISFIIKLN
jgi:hypothetical protein